MRKSEIQYHNGKPAVNVKLGYLSDLGWNDLVLKVAKHNGNARPGEFLAWWAEEIRGDNGERLQGWIDHAAQDGWEWLEDEAQEIFHRSKLKVYSEGRSGGWAIVAPEGAACFTSEDVEYWDAIACRRWGRFAKIARELADDVYYQAVGLIYINQYCTDGAEPEVRTWQAEGGDQA